MVPRRLLLTALLGAMCFGCESKSPVGPGTVTVTQSTSTTSTTSTSTIPPSTTAAFIFAPAEPAALQIVSFNAFGSSPAPGRTIVSYSWDFGDAATKTGPVVTHDFGSEGIYSVTLTGTDSAGATASVSKPIGAGTPVPPVTTTSIPTAAAVRYVAPQADPSIPSDLTLFFQQLTSLQSPLASAASGLAALRGLGPVATAVGDLTYSVQGIYSTQNGRTGTIQGEFLGLLTPAPIGIFTGTITANLPGCTATPHLWPADDGLPAMHRPAPLPNTCSTNYVLEFSSLNPRKPTPCPPHDDDDRDDYDDIRPGPISPTRRSQRDRRRIMHHVHDHPDLTNFGPATATGAGDRSPPRTTLVPGDAARAYRATGLWIWWTISLAHRKRWRLRHGGEPWARLNTQSLRPATRPTLSGKTLATATAVTHSSRSRPWRRSSATRLTVGTTNMFDHPDEHRARDGNGAA